MCPFHICAYILPNMPLVLRMTPRLQRSGHLLTGLIPHLSFLILLLLQLNITCSDPGRFCISIVLCLGSYYSHQLECSFSLITFLLLLVFSNPDQMSLVPGSTPWFPQTGNIPLQWVSRVPLYLSYQGTHVVAGCCQMDSNSWGTHVTEVTQLPHRAS